MKRALYTVTALIVCGSASAQTPPPVPSKIPGDGKLGSNAFTNEVSVESYASFAAAITVLGRATKTLVIPSSQTVADKVTVPENVSLRFTGAGMLNISSTYTVTINGNLSAPVKQIFSGAGTVAFAPNTPITALYPQWWGVVGNGSTDDTRTMQAALNAMQSDFHMVLTPGLKVKNTGLSIAGLYNFCMEGLAGAGEAVMNLPQFIYAGSDDGVHLTIAHCRGCKFKAFQMKDWSRSQDHGAGVSIWLTQDVLPRAPGGLSSDDLFEDMVMSQSQRPNWKGFRIFTTSDNNNEFHRFKHINFVGGPDYPNRIGTGISIEGAQAKQIKIEECVFAYLHIGIGRADGGSAGSFRARNNFFGCDAAYSGQFGDACVAIGDDSEGCVQIISGGGPPFTLMGGRYSGIRGGLTDTATTSSLPVISWANGKLRVIGNLFTSYTNAGFGSSFISNPGTNAPIIWEGNQVSNGSDLSGLDTFEWKESDVNVNGNPTFAVKHILNLHEDLMYVGGSPVVGLPQGNDGVYKLQNGSPATITNFVPGIGLTYPPGTLVFLIGDAHCTIQNNANIATASGADIPPFNGKMIAFYRDGTIWRQLWGGAATPMAITSNASGLKLSGDSASPGNSGPGGWIQGQGQSHGSTQFNKTDASLANVTGLSTTLQAGRTYKFRAVVDATLDPVGGGRYAIGGTCTATSINYRVRHLGASSTVTSSTRQTALGSAVNSTAGLTDDDVAIEGLITVKAGGTLTVQFAQQSANGRSSVLAGSNMLVWDMP
jgi:hypothetical protein